MTDYEMHAFGIFVEHVLACCRCDFTGARKMRLFLTGFLRAQEPT